MRVLHLVDGEHREIRSATNHFNTVLAIWQSRSPETDILPWLPRWSLGTRFCQNFCNISLGHSKDLREWTVVIGAVTRRKYRESRHVKMLAPGCDLLLVQARDSLCGVAKGTATERAQDGVSDPVQAQRVQLRGDPPARVVRIKLRAIP